VIKQQKTEQTSDSSRIETARRVFLRGGNVDLTTPLVWRVYGETFRIGS
jgi:chitosanase